MSRTRLARIVVAVLIALVLGSASVIVIRNVGDAAEAGTPSGFVH